MKYLTKVFSNDLVPLLLITFFAILAARSLIFEPGYFNMHDDLQLMRQLQMGKCFLDGQIPCRWVPDMGYGFGFPLFNYYPPLPYLMGQGIRLLGATFITTAKLTFALSFVVSGIGMYLLAKDFFGRFGGVLSSVFYIWAPYHAVDVYVRGAMNEAWALAWFPFIIWSSYRLIVDKDKLTKWVMLLAISWFALLTSHNLMIMIFAPVFVVWVAIFLWSQKRWGRIAELFTAVLLGFGLSAFFTLPVLLESKLIDLERFTLGYFNYIAHFVGLNQLLISRFWGYGDSAWALKDDGMSFQIGHLHWVGSFVVIALLGYFLLKSAKGSKGRKQFLANIRNNQILIATSYLFVVGWLSVFLIHSRSIFLWTLFPRLGILQFPWRFLAIGIFAFSFVIGFLAFSIKNTKHRGLLVGVLVFVLVALNWNYFRPSGGGMIPLQDEDKFSGEAWRLQQKAGILDYLPKTALEAPTQQREVVAEIVVGDGVVVVGSEQGGSDWLSFNTNIESKEARLRINVYQFPNWEIMVDGNKVEEYIAQDEKWGRIYIDVGSGEHFVYAKLKNTFPRLLGNTITAAAWFVLLMLGLSYFRRKKHE